MKPHVEEYAKNEEVFFKDFSQAWMKLQENGVPAFSMMGRFKALVGL